MYYFLYYYYYYYLFYLNISDSSITENTLIVKMRNFSNKGINIDFTLYFSNSYIGTSVILFLVNLSTRFHIVFQQDFVLCSYTTAMGYGGFGAKYSVFLMCLSPSHEPVIQWLSLVAVSPLCLPIIVVNIKQQ